MFAETPRERLERPPQPATETIDGADLKTRGVQAFAGLSVPWSLRAPSVRQRRRRRHAKALELSPPMIRHVLFASAMLLATAANAPALAADAPLAAVSAPRLRLAAVRPGLLHVYATPDGETHLEVLKVAATAGDLPLTGLRAISYNPNKVEWHHAPEAQFAINLERGPAGRGLRRIQAQDRPGRPGLSGGHQGQGAHHPPPDPGHGAVHPPGGGLRRPRLGQGRTEGRPLTSRFRRSDALRSNSRACGPGAGARPGRRPRPPVGRRHSRSCPTPAWAVR